ncbi:MAG: hypothetical protein A2096_16375 [Spirochaetes bacterium GWF1_41_5]|nr:MAG: hypothetical protein A2096_16375 [Spirochaetes bacterium GWF1_41_5]
MLNETIDKIKQIIIDEYHPDKIILFGSYARGDYRPDSDIDLLIISDKEKDLPRYKRGLQVRLKLSKVHAAKDLLFYTHDDFNKWKHIRQSFAASVAREGVNLYEK